MVDSVEIAVGELITCLLQLHSSLVEGDITQQFDVAAFHLQPDSYTGLNIYIVIESRVRSSSFAGTV